MREVIMRLTPKEFEDGDHAEIAQELVRCKDCKFYETEAIGYCDNFGWLVKPEFFCADGEKG